jgi:hypothetical protein
MLLLSSLERGCMWELLLFDHTDMFVL